MIAMRRLRFRGWGVEADMRVRVVRPQTASESKPVRSLAQRAASESAMQRRADRARNDIERLWRLHGGVV